VFRSAKAVAFGLIYHSLGQLRCGEQRFSHGQATSLAGTLAGTIGTPIGTLPFSRFAASRLHHSHQHRNAGLSELEGLQGIRPCQSAGRLEHMAYVRALAGGADTIFGCTPNEIDVERSIN
jgi:hypothetical protein